MTNIDKKTNKSSSREAVLDAAEKLFTIRGYKTVKLKHIADNLGIKQASIYYHFPLGKEDLYIEVMLRHLEHRRSSFEKLISTAKPTLEDCLFNVGIWLIKQPPLNGAKIIINDLPELSSDKANQLEEEIYSCGFAPMESLFARYKHQLKEQFRSNPGFVAGSFLCSLESLYAVKHYGNKTDEELVLDLIELILRGGCSD
ncbi:TetR family transcriptional regulator protein [Calothrix parasitica NIES-267]|uniref:TetR family transcriptional regulator protein n=1 Tax=Calothrix parasitica NIES-267 TaxID=1973488 RepID=A0A1Z4LRG1_9CYAN|nr:TetR family transcriptional regulator protein [Calothrix parasitica NIES-267]